MYETNKLESAQQMYLKICRALDDRGWHYNKDDETLQISFGVNGEDLPMDFKIKVDVERSVIFMMSPLQFKIAEDKRVDIAVAVNAVNCMLVQGNFDFDIQSGALGFRMTQSFLETDISGQTLQAMISISCNIVDDYNDKFMGISKGMISMQQFLSELYAN